MFIGKLRKAVLNFEHFLINHVVNRYPGNIIRDFVNHDIIKY